MHAEDRLRVWRTGCSARRQRPLWLAASMALAAVLGAVCTVAPAAATAVFVDSDSSAAAGAMARSAASLWQAWTPAWSGPLAAIDIHLGAVQVRRGTPPQASAHHQPAHTHHCAPPPSLHAAAPPARLVAFRLTMHTPISAPCRATRSAPGLHHHPRRTAH